jgi:hypothetical protein
MFIILCFILRRKYKNNNHYFAEYFFYKLSLLTPDFIAYNFKLYP